LREGLFVTAIPQGSNIILRFETIKSDTGQREAITEVAISAELGRTFFNLIKAALTTAESIFSTQNFASSWELELHAESKPGGEIVVKVEGDEAAQFTLAWEFSNPRRPIDSFTMPEAFSKGATDKENISGTVHFYDDPNKGIVVVSAEGEHGLFDIAYHLETSVRKVKPDKTHHK
jgi:hypothetical protein